MPQFDHEKLDVYKQSLEFIRWTSVLMLEVREAKIFHLRETIDQLDLASVSIILNIAEGNGRRGTQQRAKFFDDARGSATECAGCLDVLVAKTACSQERVAEGKNLLHRIVSMLCKLVHRFDTRSRTTDEKEGRGR